MAAAIKMDELLVSWLGSDNVYDTVQKLIESHKQQQQQQQQQQQDVTSDSGSNSMLTPPVSPTPSTNTTTTTTSTPTNATTQQQQQQQQQRRGIPPFYHPPINKQHSNNDDDTNNSTDPTLMVFPRRPSFDHEDVTWEGTNISSSTVTTTNTSAATSSSNNSAKIPPPPPPPLMNDTATNMDSPNNKQSPQKLSISVQVKEIFEELGQKISSSLNDEEKEEEQLYLTSDAFVKITKDICHFPTFFNGPLYKRILYLWQTKVKESTKEQYQAYMNNTAASSQQDEDYITYEMMEWYWKLEMQKFDLSDRFFRLVKAPYRNYITRDDFLPFIKELLNDHPGLEFLSTHAEFQEKYAVTVITRIFYTVNKCHSGRITARQIRHSDILEAFQQVDEEEDINKVTKYFSYEHFYVLYCRFWELDHDRDYRITRDDLLKYSEHCLSHLIVDRIFDAAPRPFGGNAAAIEQQSSSNHNSDGDEEKQKLVVNRDFLNYEDFIYFMLSEEDKANEISIRYWFTCVDVDGDGKLNNMELRSFYMVQLHRMQCMGHEIVPFEDMLCQMMDMIKPKCQQYLVVEDFLQNECATVSGALFDALFNLNKYMQFEQRDPFQERQKRDDEFDSDWDRFAFVDYNRLAMEEENREDAMEIDWVAVDEEEDDEHDIHSLGFGGASEAPF